MTNKPDEKTAAERFTLDEGKRNRLKQLLSDPLLVEAFALAEGMMKPSVGTAADANQPLAIAKYHQSAGADEFQNKLRRLTREYVRPVKPTGKQLATSADDLPKD